MQNVLEQGPDFWRCFDTFRTIVFNQYMQRCFQSKCYYISVKLRRGIIYSFKNNIFNSIIILFLVIFLLTSSMKINYAFNNLVVNFFLIMHD